VARLDSSVAGFIVQFKVVIVRKLSVRSNNKLRYYSIMKSFIHGMLADTNFASPLYNKIFCRYNVHSVDDDYPDA